MPLPLLLVPFEEYMLVDDRPTHPMSFFVRLGFAGDCDTDALDVALRRSLVRHPLLAAARSLGTTVNNLLARDLFLAIDDFRTQIDIGRKCEWLRLSIPINLRAEDDERLPATNVMSFIFLDRKSKDLADRDALLNGIHRKMRLVKQLRLGLTFPLSLRLSRAIPGSLRRWRRISQKDICHGTAVLSNLGKPLLLVPLPRREGKIIAGSLTLERIELLPPVRPYTAVAIGVLTYAEKLNVALHYDSRAVTEEDAQSLLAGYVRRLQETMSI